MKNQYLLECNISGKGFARVNCIITEAIKQSRALLGNNGLLPISISIWRIDGENNFKAAQVWTDKRAWIKESELTSEVMDALGW